MLLTPWRGRPAWAAAIAACFLIASPALLPARAQDQELKVTQADGVLTVLTGDQPTLRYRYEGAPFKPYAKELCTRHGVNVLLDAPPEQAHHHGLMFGLTVDGVNFWQEGERAGKEVHRALENVLPPPDRRADTATFTELLDWLTPDGKLLLNEQRTITVHDDGFARIGRVVLVTWKTRLSAPPGIAEVKLSGSHDCGLGLRFVRALERDGKFVYARRFPGDVVRGDERLTPDRWCAFAGSVDGKNVTVAIFDYPHNPRAPATWFTMKEPLAYLSATPGLGKEPLVLKADAPLELRYGIALWDEPVVAEQIERVYTLWVDRFAGPPATTLPSAPRK